MTRSDPRREQSTPVTLLQPHRVPHQHHHRRGEHGQLALLGLAGEATDADDVPAVHGRVLRAATRGLAVI